MKTLKDKQVEVFIGQVLRMGVLLASFVTLIGFALYLAHHGFSTPDYHIFHPLSQMLRSVHQILANAFHGNPRAIMQLGVLLLIATPVARVAFLVAAFALERDGMYVAVSGLVLAILLYSLVFSA